MYKSKFKAFTYSTIVPGAGHLYMEKLKFRNALLPLGIYGISVATAINSNASYNRHRSDFETYQGLSITSLDPVLSSVNKEKAQKSWDKMDRADDMFIGAVVSAIFTNIATSIWLILSS